MAAVSPAWIGEPDVERQHRGRTSYDDTHGFSNAWRRTSSAPLDRSDSFEELQEAAQQGMRLRRIDSYHVELIPAADDPLNAHDERHQDELQPFPAEKSRRERLHKLLTGRSGGHHETGQSGKHSVIQLHRRMTRSQQELLIETQLAGQGQDNEEMLRKIRKRLDRAGIELHKVEVRFFALTITAKVYVGSRGLPTLMNTFRNSFEKLTTFTKLSRSTKTTYTILKSISGVLKPARMTLLLGPPGSGKTSLLKALAGLLPKHGPMEVQGHITYNGMSMDQFEPRRTAAYISQEDSHLGMLTVRETLEFAAMCQGVGHKAAELQQLREAERAQGIEPDPEVDAFLKAMALGAKRGYGGVGVELIIRLLGLDVCADTIVGDQMTRGCSGGQRKRVTTAEMAVGPKKTFYMDEISTGLDSSTTLSIVRCLRNFSHLRDATLLVALLQPPPETFNLFDDVMLLSEGVIVYQGPITDVLGFFAAQGFQCPPRKGTADFLQEVTSIKDQGQYWMHRDAQHAFLPVEAFHDVFRKTDQGSRLLQNASEVPEPTEIGRKALVHKRYALSWLGMLKVNLWREQILMRRQKFLYGFRTFQVCFLATFTAFLFFRTTWQHNFEGGNLVLSLLFFSLLHMFFNSFSEMSLLINNLPVVYKQRDSLFYSGATYSLPGTLSLLPFSLLEGAVWTGIIYWVVGLAPDAGRFFLFALINVMTHAMAANMFRAIGALGRTMVVANTFGSFFLALVFLTSGITLAKDAIPGWYIWAFWASPLNYAMRCISTNEFSSSVWNDAFPASGPGSIVRDAVLTSRSLPVSRFWTWLGLGVLAAFYMLFTVLTALCLSFLNPWRGSSPTVSQEVLDSLEMKRSGRGSVHTGHASQQGDGVEGVQMQHKAKSPQCQPAAPTATAVRSASGYNDLRSNSHKYSNNGSLQTVQDPVGPAFNGDVHEQARTGGFAAVHGSEPAHSEHHSSVTAFGGPTTPSTSFCINSHDDEELGDNSVFSMPKVNGLNGTSPLKGSSQAGSAQSLPFRPMFYVFKDVSYFVPMPSKDKASKQGDGAPQQELQLLCKISGSFRPGVLTALMGASGAGKTTLLDVLAQRKTVGRTTGQMFVDGHPVVPETFARVVGYVEQQDIHSPQMTVRESLIFSARLRLPRDVESSRVIEHVDDIAGIVELDTIAGSIVGLPGASGLSVEQRKRLTIAVELVANPAIVFMDEPTSGIDARSAAIVARCIRNIVDTQRTVVCTIHQPSQDIFEAFDELLLLKRGGRTIYNGILGNNAQELIAYFESLSDQIPRSEPDLNPASWMLDISTQTMEAKLNLDYFTSYENSKLRTRVDELVAEGSHPPPDSQPLHFPSVYAQSKWTQLSLLMWRNNHLYWRSPDYNANRFVFTAVIGFIIGTLYWDIGMKRSTEIDVTNIMGALYAAALFLGINNASSVQPVVGTERAVFYRERAAGLYAALPYAITQVAIELPYILAQTAIYSLLTYFLIGFQTNAAKFWWYFLYSFLTFTYWTMYGIAAVAISPSVQLAAVLSSFFYSLWNLMSGFLITVRQMPPWLKWFYYLNPVAWSLNGLISSQLGDVTNEFITTADGTVLSVAQYIDDTFAFTWEYRIWSFLVLFGFIIAFWLVIMSALRFLNWQKR